MTLERMFIFKVKFIYFYARVNYKTGTTEKGLNRPDTRADNIFHLHRTGISVVIQLIQYRLSSSFTLGF